MVEVAQHTEGWLFTEPERAETKASDVDAGRFNRKRMYLTVGELGLVSLY